MSTITPKSGQNNTFYGNTVIATKSIKIGNGSFVNRFINWTNGIGTLITGGTLIVRQLAFTQFGDKLTLIFDLTVENVSFVSIVINVGGMPVTVGPISGSVVLKINDVTDIAGEALIISSNNLTIRGTPSFNIGDNVSVVGELSFVVANI